MNATHFVPGEKRIVSCSDDGTVRVWEKESGEQLLIIRTKSGGNDVAISPDGKALAVRSLNLISLYPLDLSLYDADPAVLLAQAEKEAGQELLGFTLAPRTSE